MQMKTFQDLLSINVSIRLVLLLETQFLRDDLQSLTITINALSAAADVIIATSLCILLHRQRTGFRRCVCSF